MTRLDDIQARWNHADEPCHGECMVERKDVWPDVRWLLDRVTQLETALEKAEERLCAIYELAGSGEARDVLRAALDTEQT